MSIKARFLFNYPQAKQSEAFNFDVDITLPATGISVIYGPSGCGKTTLLRCIAGLHKTESGELQIGDEVWQSKQRNLPTYQRSLAYVFQEASLFSHLSADKNLQYAIDRAPKTAVTISKEQVVDLMALEPLLGKLPAELSGGEQQRVAIARALLSQAKLILMDEPLSALDNQRKDEILPYLEKLRSTFNLPIIYVTHSIQELTRLADYVVLMNKGQVSQHGPVTTVLSDLENNDQFGDETSVVLMAKVAEKDATDHLVRVELGGESIWLQDNGETLGQKIRLRILAKDISLTLSAHEDTSILNRIPVTVNEIKPARNGATSWLSLTIDRSKERKTLVASITQRSLKHLNLEVGTKVWAQIKSVALLSAYHD